MRSKMMFLMLGCLLMTILVGCGEVNSPPSGPYDVSGYVCTKDGVWRISGATVNFSGGLPSVITGADGSWSKAGLSGSVTITPSKLGFTFSPSSRQVTGNAANIYFRMTGFTDNFSDDTSGWSIYSDTDVDYSYQSSEYEIKVKKANFVYYSCAPFPVSGDYTVQVDCRSEIGTQGSYGIIFDLKDDNYYFFDIDPFTRQYELNKYLGASGWASSKPINWTSSDKIRANATDINTMKVVKTGSQVELWINENKITTITSDLTASAVALATYSEGSDLVAARFDNFQFLATGPEASSLSVKNQTEILATKGFGATRR